jgi:uncharacterized RDD family membrane protein YckC
VTLQVSYPPALVRHLQPERRHFEVELWVPDIASFEMALRLNAPGGIEISWVSPPPKEGKSYVFESADLPRRAAAFALDIAFAFLLTTTAAAVLFASGVPNAAWAWFGFPGVWLMYTWAANALGQSEGKRIMKLRVESQSGGPPGLWRGLRRTIGQLIIGLPLVISYLWVLTNPERRGLHDLLAGTRVVRPVRRTVSQPAAGLASDTWKASGP